MFARLMGLNVISPAALQQRIQQHEPITVIDVNSRQSWLTARVPGALTLDPLAYDEKDLPDKNSTLVFYCSGLFCRKAPNAARRAEAMGYRNVFVMSAGISGWLAARLPTESGAVGA